MKTKYVEDEWADFDSYQGPPCELWYHLYGLNQTNWKTKCVYKEKELYPCRFWLNCYNISVNSTALHFFNQLFQGLRTGVYCINCFWEHLCEVHLQTKHFTVWSVILHTIIQNAHL